MNKWLLLLLPITLNTAFAQVWYSEAEIENIVVQHAMPFWTFPQNHHQYGVLLLLPENKVINLVPENPGTLNARNEYTRDSYDRELIEGDVLLGINYAVARPSADGQLHTEAQLLRKLPIMLGWYEIQFRRSPSALLLYTRGTPCSGCTDAISFARRYDFPNGQFVVAYTVNMITPYMNPTLNCKNRVILRYHYGVAIICVRERYDANAGRNQCLENDFQVACEDHNSVYGRSNRGNNPHSI